MEIYKGILLYFSECKFQFINEYINNTLITNALYQLFQFCIICANVIKILLLLYYYSRYNKI